MCTYILRHHSYLKSKQVSLIGDVPEAVNGSKVAGVPDVKSGAENVRLAKLVHLALGVTNLSDENLLSWVH